jgi:hypothetical protein
MFEPPNITALVDIDVNTVISSIPVFSPFGLEDIYWSRVRVIRYRPAVEAKRWTRDQTLSCLFMASLSGRPYRA